jgi:4-aminobutyrate aminotransferase-like enzyme
MAHTQCPAYIFTPFVAYRMGKASEKTLFKLHYNESEVDSQVDFFFDIAERMKEQGILIGIDGPLYNVIKIKPPIAFTKAYADRYIDTIDKILDNI